MHGTPVKRGWLVAFEGLDGSGKSTQLARLATTLRAAGRDVVVTREPTDGPVGRRIRAMARRGERVAPAQELRWFVEDRREHVAHTIRPALEAGRVVLTDRYYLSTVAYQGARGLDFERILADSEAEFPLPDRVLLFEIEPEAALARVRSRPGSGEPAFEEAGYLARVASIFAALERPYLVRIDARPPPDEVERRVATSLACLLPASRGT